MYISCFYQRTFTDDFLPNERSHHPSHPSLKTRASCKSNSWCLHWVEYSQMSWVRWVSVGKPPIPVQERRIQRFRGFDAPTNVTWLGTEDKHVRQFLDPFSDRLLQKILKSLPSSWDLYFTSAVTDAGSRASLLRVPTWSGIPTIDSCIIPTHAVLKCSSPACLVLKRLDDACAVS